MPAMRIFKRVAQAAFIACLALSLLTMATPAHAQQNWPTRAVTMMVPFAAGGVTDGVARVIAKTLGDAVGQQFVIENRGGAAGNLAAAAVAKAQPDGYTLLFTTTGPASVNQLLYKSVGFDPVKDFTNVVMIGIVPQIVVASAKLPVKTLAELVAYGKAHPGQLTFGNSGVGTMAHISAVSLARATGLEVTHVPYRGGSPVMTDLLGGQIDVGFPAYVPQVTQMKSLAITGTERMALMPDVPTVRETGVADVVAGTWFGISAPAGMPRPIVERINAEVNRYLKSAAAKELFDTLGVAMIGGTPEDMTKYVADETARWAPVIKSENIHLN